MYYSICHKTNHNVETCRIKRKEDLVLIVSQITTQHIKVKKPMRYSYHICGDTGHKIIDYPKHNDMQNMFKSKGVKPIDKQVVVKPKVSNPSVHMVDVNMAITKSKVTEEQLFKDKKPIKNKYVVDWEEEHKTITIFCQDYTRDVNKRPTIKFDLKGESTMEYKLGKIVKI
jgi:hypothetical protein